MKMSSPVAEIEMRGLNRTQGTPAKGCESPNPEVPIVSQDESSNRASITLSKHSSLSDSPKSIDASLLSGPPSSEEEGSKMTSTGLRSPTATQKVFGSHMPQYSAATWFDRDVVEMIMHFHGIPSDQHEVMCIHLFTKEWDVLCSQETMTCTSSSTHVVHLVIVRTYHISEFL